MIGLRKSGRTLQDFRTDLLAQIRWPLRPNAGGQIPNDPLGQLKTWPATPTVAPSGVHVTIHDACRHRYRGLPVPGNRDARGECDTEETDDECRSPIISLEVPVRYRD
jgi:hypothetical protein